MKTDVRLINAVNLGRQKFNEEVKQEKEAIENWLEDNLFNRIRVAAGLGASHVNIYLNDLPNCRHYNKQYYVRSYIEGIDGLEWGKHGKDQNGYNEYICLKWSKELGN